MDRDYWRSAPTKRLIEEARESGHELCIALGERLEAREAEEALVDEIDDLNQILADLRDQIDELERERAAAEEEVSSASVLLARIELIVSGNARVPTPTLEDLLPEINAWLDKVDGEGEDGNRP